MSSVSSELRDVVADAAKNWKATLRYAVFCVVVVVGASLMPWERIGAAVHGRPSPPPTVVVNNTYDAPAQPVVPPPRPRQTTCASPGS
jgi:hypothetical protein